MAFGITAPVRLRRMNAYLNLCRDLHKLSYAFILRKRTGAVIPKAIYNKLMAEVKASQPQPQEPSAASEQEQPTAEVVGEPSPLARQYGEMKAKHPDAILLFRVGDFYYPNK